MFIYNFRDLNFFILHTFKNCLLFEIKSFTSVQSSVPWFLDLDIQTLVISSSINPPKEYFIKGQAH